MVLFPTPPLLFAVAIIMSLLSTSLLTCLQVRLYTYIQVNIAIPSRTCLSKCIYRDRKLCYETSMPIRKGTKRTWDAGKPRLPGASVRRLIILTEEHNNFLGTQPNASRLIRQLLDQEMARTRGESIE